MFVCCSLLLFYYVGLVCVDDVVFTFSLIDVLVIVVVWYLAALILLVDLD